MGVNLINLDKIGIMDNISFMSAMLSAQKSAPTLQEFGDIPTVTASDLKHHIGEVIHQAMKGPLAITRHNRTELVLLSADKFMELQRSHKGSLDAMTAEFDTMVAQMNTPAAKRGVKKLFQTTPRELGNSAVLAAKAHAR